MKFNPARRASKNKERPSSTFAADIGLSGGTGGGGIQSGSRQPKAVAASGEVVRRPADCPCPYGPPVAQPATPTRSAIASRAVRDLMADLLRSASPGARALSRPAEHPIIFRYAAEGSSSRVRPGKNVITRRSGRSERLPFPGNGTILADEPR